MRSLILRYLFPRLSAALLRLAWISGGLPNKPRPTTMPRLSPADAVSVTQTAYDTISMLKASNADLRAAVAPLAADNEALKARLAAADADDAQVDAALAKLAELLNPLNVPGDDAAGDETVPVDAPPAAEVPVGVDPIDPPSTPAPGADEIPGL